MSGHDRNALSLSAQTTYSNADMLKAAVEKAVLTNPEVSWPHDSTPAAHRLTRSTCLVRRIFRA